MQRQETEEEFAGRLMREPIRTTLNSILTQYTEGRLNLHDLGAIQQQMRDHGIEFSYLGNPDVQSNNKPFLVTAIGVNPPLSAVLHISVKDEHEEALRKAIQELGNSKPLWTSHEFGDINEKIGPDVYHLRVTQKCTTLINIIKDIQQLSEGQRLQAVAKLAGKISDFLNDVSNLNSIFTDMKEGNVFFDGNGQLQAVDTKSMLNAGYLRKDSSGITFAADTTPGYVSPDFQEKGSMLPADATSATVLAVWQREYSYQLAIMIHRMATGDPRLSEPKKDSQGIHRINFDFSHAIFQTKEGKQLQALITKLSDANPDNRMNHADGVAELQKIAKAAAKNEEKLMAKMKKMTPLERVQFIEKAKKQPEKLVQREQAYQRLLKNMGENEGALLREFEAIAAPGNRVYETMVKKAMNDADRDTANKMQAPQVRRAPPGHAVSDPGPSSAVQATPKTRKNSDPAPFPGIKIRTEGSPPPARVRSNADTAAPPQVRVRSNADTAAPPPPSTPAPHAIPDDKSAPAKKTVSVSIGVHKKLGQQPHSPPPAPPESSPPSPRQAEQQKWAGHTRAAATGEKAPAPAVTMGKKSARKSEEDNAAENSKESPRLK